MNGQLGAVVAVVGALVIWAGWMLGRAWRLQRRLGGNRVVTCPETGQPALVHIDVALAVTAQAGSEPAPLDACSCWQERGRCEQPCLHAAHAARPADVVHAWARGRSCATCGRTLDAAGRGGRQTALLAPDGATRDWRDVPVAQLPLALATSLPVCANCHVAETFRRQHPELVTDRDV